MFSQEPDVMFASRFSDTFDAYISFWLDGDGKVRSIASGMICRLFYTYVVGLIKSSSMLIAPLDISVSCFVMRLM